MKKFLVFFVFLFGLACSAMAAPVEYKSGDYVCARVDADTRRVGDDRGTVLYSYSGKNTKIEMFFDTGNNTGASGEYPGCVDGIGIHDGCEEKYKEINNLLKKDKADIERLIVIGSADLQGSTTGYNNVKLAQCRAYYAADKIFTGYGYNKYIAGDADAQAWDPERIDNNLERTVNIYVIWRRQNCKDMAANKVQKIENSLNDDTIDWEKAEKLQVKDQLTDIISRAKGKIADLKKICAGPNDNKQLTPTEVKTYDNLLGDLGTIIAELLKLNAKLPEQIISDNGVSSLTDIYFNITIEIDEIYARLLKARESFDVSVWRNAEGKFNTARLASDSIAGVVLGTVGGIVTSKLVKKNQLKKGFEDLSCHVGGQRVADYGDSFRMGLEN